MSLAAAFPGRTGRLDPHAVTGTWYVTRTSLPLWRRLDNPSVTYALLPDGRVVDMVRATAAGRPRLIVGLDRPLGHGAAAAGRFEWRGLTLPTCLTPSRWELLAHDPQAQVWAVTVFAPTLFTPAGLDVYTRTPRLLPDLEAPLLRLLDTLPQARPFLARLFAPRHD